MNVCAKASKDVVISFRLATGLEWRVRLLQGNKFGNRSTHTCDFIRKYRLEDFSLLYLLFFTHCGE